MTNAKPMSDEQLLELVRETDPLTAGSGPRAAETETDQLVRRILFCEPNALPAKREIRLAGARLRRRPYAAVLGISGGAAGAAVAAILLVTAGSAPSVALAGWSADPTTPANGQVQTAESTCASDNVAPASIAPTVIDTRGPYTALLYAESDTIAGCIASQSGTGTSTAPAVVAGLTSEPGTARAGASQVAAGIVSWWQAGEAGGQPGQPPISLVDGQVGAGVTSVELELEDGSSVQATVANGWCIAWWPGIQSIQAAKVTTTSGTTTQPAPRLGGGLARMRALRETREALTQAQGTAEPGGTITTGR